jgi:hypothetical protein
MGKHPIARPDFLNGLQASLSHHWRIGVEAYTTPDAQYFVDHRETLLAKLDCLYLIPHGRAE